MADKVILGTSGNDVLQFDAAGTSNGSLVLTVAGTIAENQRPLFDVLVNGVVVRSGILITADNHLGDTQQVYVPLPAGQINSVTIDYTNDPQQDYSTQDRNIYVKAVSLNGTNLATSTASYTRDDFVGSGSDEASGHVIAGREDMNWGGEMTFSGAAVQNATAGPGGKVLIDAGAGLDTVNFSGARADYVLSHTSTGFSITPVGGGTTTSFGSVERLSFGDGTHVAIDTDGTGDLAARMIATALGSSFLTNKSIVATALDYLDHGMDAVTLMGGALETDSFKALAGGGTNEAFVRYVYHNVAGSDISQSDLDMYVGWLNTGFIDKAHLAMAAANLDVTEAIVVGAGVGAHGIEY